MAGFLANSGQHISKFDLGTGTLLGLRTRGGTGARA